MSALGIERRVGPYSIKADADLSTKEGYCIQIQSDGDAALMTDGTIAGGQVFGGIIEQGGGNTAGQMLSVAHTGLVQAVCGDTLTRGTHSALTCDSSGRVVPQTSADKRVAIWANIEDKNYTVGQLCWVKLADDPRTSAVLGGTTGSTDNALLRADGTGGVTVQGSGANATLSDAGALTLAAGLTVSSGGATVTGNSTITGTLGGLTGVTVASGNVTLTTGNIVLSQAGATVDGVDLTATRALIDAFRVCSLTAAAENSNNIDVAIQVKDLSGNNVAAAVKVACFAATTSVASDVTLSEVGAGSADAASAAADSGQITVLTDANGAATVRVNTAATGSIPFMAIVTPETGASVFGLPSNLTLVFA